MLFNGPDNPQTLSIPLGDLDPSLSNTWFLELPKSTLQSASRSVRPFFVGLSNVTNKQTDTQTDRTRYSACSNNPHLAIAAMRPKNTVGLMPAIYHLSLPELREVGDWASILAIGWAKTVIIIIIFIIIFTDRQRARVVIIACGTANWPSLAMKLHRTSVAAWMTAIGQRAQQQ